LRLRSVLAVPLIARGVTLGVVYLDDRVRRGAFGPDEIGWVNLVASLAAFALADARDQVLLRRAVRRARRAQEALAETLAAREDALEAVERSIASGPRSRHEEIVGTSAVLARALRLVDRVAPTDVPVLLLGETGTGKELFARAIHRHSRRQKERFLSENCGAIPEPLLESTLFGHARGAFTGAVASRVGLFELADRGTLFLDEVGEMSVAMQTKLLRVLQDGEVRPVGATVSRRVDVRVICATHRDLALMVREGKFREDLYYRLRVIEIAIPPLRDRREDIPLLVKHLIARHGEGRPCRVAAAALEQLISAPWPGNIRQLENVMRAALVLSDGTIDRSHLTGLDPAPGAPAAASGSLRLKERVDALEAELIREAMQRTRGNQSRAAELLGVSRFGLQKMLKRLGIVTNPPYREG
jgi:transcriptional regulator with GAF, ATPase, and Fis domain